MKNKYDFFLIFLMGLLFIFIGIFALAFSSHFMYMIVVLLGIFILIDALGCFMKKEKHFIEVMIRIGFALVLLLCPQLPISIVVMIFAVYICITGLSHFITYYYYQKESVSGRFLFLISAIVMLILSISFLLSPYIHTQEMTYLCAFYIIYLGFKYMTRAMRELLLEDRKNSLKRRIRVSLPIFMVAFIPRIVIEYINKHLELKSEEIIHHQESSLEVFVHVSEEGFGAIGHVDICYQGEVIAYGAYDEASTRLFGAIGDGVLFTVEKNKYLEFCKKDDPKSYIFAYSLYLDEQQTQRIEETIENLKQEFVPWQPPYMHHHEAKDYASRLYKATDAQFYKFQKGQFKYYFVMTTNCVLLADRIIGKSGIDIVNMNGIITPGTYFSYFEEESKKEHSRVLHKRIY